MGGPPRIFTKRRSELYWMLIHQWKNTVVRTHVSQVCIHHSPQQLWLAVFHCASARFLSQ